MKNTLLLIILFTFHSNLFAKEIFCEKDQPYPFKSIDVEEGKSSFGVLTCNRVDQIASIVFSLQKVLVPSGLTLPKSLDLKILHKFDNAYYAWGQVVLPYSLTIDKFEKHPNHTLNVWSHEFGHAIFNESMGKLIPKWNDLKFAMALLMPLYNEQGKLASELEKENDPFKVVAIQTRLKEITEKMKEIRKTFYEAFILNDISASYNEFFADIVAVIYSQKGDAIYDALFRTGLGFETNKSFIARDFTNRSNEITKWNPTQDDLEIHNLLAPARYHVWKYYLDNPIYAHNKGVIAKESLRAISREIVKFKDTYGPFIKSYGYSKDMAFTMNKSLINQIDTIMIFNK